MNKGQIWNHFSSKETDNHTKLVTFRVPNSVVHDFDELIKLKLQYNKNYKQITNYSNFTIHLRDYQLEAEKQIRVKLSQIKKIRSKNL